ncbi:MAG: phosphoglucomutase, partial [Rubrobacteridae bacterium]|nr:phosphoglucomutase [Rubrobacteridae bacterium]
IPSEDVLHLFVNLAGRYEKSPGKVAVPLSVSSVAENIAKEAGREIIRTKVSSRAMMEAALEPDVVFVGSQDGDFIFPRFMPAYDGIMSLFKLMEYIANANTSLSGMVNELPLYHVANKVTFCPWDKKGLVMRRILEYTKELEIEMIDGVKIYSDDGWVLILPDPDEPVVIICAESSSQESANADIEKYSKIVEDIISSD